MKDVILNVKKNLRPLGVSGRSDFSAMEKEYFRFYGLDFSGGGLEHIFGSFRSGRYNLAGHIYKPARYIGAVFLLHGYFNHMGQLSKLTGHLLGNGFAVALFDLPGHGLSSGRGGEINGFRQYSLALVDFSDIVRSNLDSPYHFIGHSTGASAYLDYALKTGDDIFDRVILASPLVHCSGWNQTKISYNQKVRFFKKVPRVFRQSSSDPDFLEFVKNKDPLQSRAVPLKWVRALHKWNEEILNLPSCEKGIKIIQGASDKTVDWKYNIKFLKSKFSDIDICLLKKARHELFNESREIRNEVFSRIIDYLEG